MPESRLEADEQARKRRMSWDHLEATVRAQNANAPEAKPLEFGQAVAWISRDNNKASNVSAVHHHYQNGQTFCRLDIPPARQHLPVLPSLDVCRRCAAMSRRALHYAHLQAAAAAKAAGGSEPPMKASA